ncbi:major facilitator superfamily domain-containing protein [Choanephora cucurbitarum]|nr:major facilitator superfamily domain-containing protein [Choanephora cucurbitarum]
MSEATPLLNRHISTKATAWHGIIPFSLLTFVAGAMAAPLVELFATAFCYKYYRSKSTDIELDIPVENCAIPEVQKLASEAQGLFMFLIYAASLLTASHYGRLSDRKGRRLVFMISTTGGCLTMLSYILTFNFPELFGTWLLFIVPAIYGLCGGDSLISATVQAYIADCTSHDTRSAMFSRLIAGCSISSALGASLASCIISSTGSINYVLWMAFAICLAFLLYVIFAMPESRVFEKSKQPIQQTSLMDQLNIFSSLRIFLSNSNKDVYPYALLFAAIDDFLFAFIAFPPVLLYVMYKFGWTAYEGGIFNGLTNFVRFITTSLIVPYLSQQFHAMYASRDDRNAVAVPESSKAVPAINSDTIEIIDDENEAITKRSLMFDAYMIRASFAFESLSFFIFATTNSGAGIMVAGFIRGLSSMGVAGSCSFMSKLVDSSQIGELTSALSIIESIASKVDLFMFVCISS